MQPADIVGFWQKGEKYGFKDGALASELDTMIDTPIGPVDPDLVLSKLSPQEDSVVILSGTLIEGIGNSHSDLDVYGFAPHLPDAGAARHNFSVVEEDKLGQFYDYIDDSGLGFDVEFYTYLELSEIIGSMDQLYARAKASTKLLRAQLPHEEEDLIHKLLVGQILKGDRAHLSVDFENLRDRFCFLKYRNLVGGFPEFKDVRGAFTSGDCDTALFTMRNYVSNQALGMTCLIGDSNPKVRWLSRKLKRLPPPLRDLGEDVIAWHFAGAPTDAAKRALIIDGAVLVDRIFDAMRPYIGTRPAYYDLKTALALTEREFMAETFHDHQTMEEFEFRRRQFDAGRASTVSFLEHR
jgi:hypothetical protein